MRFLLAGLLAMPVLACAQQQIPFMDTVKSWQKFLVSKAIPQAGTGTTAAQPSHGKSFGPMVQQLSLGTWKSVIAHSGARTKYDAPEAWMVYITGQNQTCRENCARPDAAFQEAVELFADDVSAPRLASIDCDVDAVLCGSLVADASTIWFFIVPYPAADQSRPATNIYLFPLNGTTVTSSDITNIHTRRKYNHMKPYEGPMHPFDGWVTKLGLTEPLAYGMYYISKIPSWAFMIGMSFFSRQYMSKRMVGRQGPVPIQPRVAPAAPARG